MNKLTKLFGTLSKPSSHTFQVPDRKDIEQSTQGKTTDYPNKVKVVNLGLDVFDVGISARSKRNVIDNVNKVEQGERSEITAHLIESQSFARDSFASLVKGQVKQGVVEGIGAVLNLGAAGLEASHTQTPSEKWGVDPY